MVEIQEPSEENRFLHIAIARGINVDFVKDSRRKSPRLVLAYIAIKTKTN
jgi:hypothetical protein